MGPPGEDRMASALLFDPFKKEGSDVFAISFYQERTKNSPFTQKGGCHSVDSNLFRRPNR